MRTRILAPFVLAAAGLAAVPASATETSLVVTRGSTYYPGDKSLPADTLFVFEGADLRYTNLDTSTGHTLTSNDFVPGTTRRLFNSGPVLYSQSVLVEGVPALAPGRYTYSCAIHGPGQGGALVVVDVP